MKVFRNVLFLVLGFAVFASCSSDDDKFVPAEDASIVQVAIRTSNGAKAKLVLAETNSLFLDKLYMNISEIEFDIHDDMKDKLPGNDDLYSDVELKGPFPINLLSDKAMSDNGWLLATTNVPNGIYEEIEFEFEDYKGDNDDFKELFGNTIYASGTVVIDDQTVPFTIESDEEVEIELEYENEGLVLDGSSSKVYIDLDLQGMISSLIEFTSLDFVNADRETDGSIVISNKRNKKILDKFNDVVEFAFEALEDKYDN